MFQQSIWATDGSDNADRALEYVKRLAEADHSKVLAVHVHELTTGRAAGYPVYIDEDALAAKVNDQVEALKDAGVEAELRVSKVAVGGTAHVLADAASEAGVDVIVVGTRGMGPVKGLLVGSVTERLLKVAPCPVLAVPPGSCPGKAAGSPQTVQRRPR